PMGSEEGAISRPLTVLIPLRSLSGAKTRLDHVLDPAERAELATRLLRDVLEAVRRWGRADRVIVVAADPAIRELADELGAETFVQRSTGMKEGLEEARVSLDGAARTLLVLPADLPTVSAESLERLEAAASEAAAAEPGSRRAAPGARRDGSPFVIVVPDSSGEGTNALLLRPPDAIPFAFGNDSRRAHVAAAERGGAAVRTVHDDELSFDLDT